MELPIKGSFMDSKKGFGIALRKIRKAKNLTQEDFEETSSRTYLSTLERGIKSPTLEKVEALSTTLGVHPLTLLISTYVEIENQEYDQILNRVMNEIQELKKG
jgi:transcriptional regulator with XRE-family HTH domain